jgi:hypothetical protein
MATQAEQSPGTQAEQPPEALAPLASDLCWLLSRASHGLTIEFTAALERLGISPRAHSVLFTAMTGEFTQTEIAKMVGLDKTRWSSRSTSWNAPASPSGVRRAPTGARV